jgi:cobalt-zinc-cadmium efflux system membrane fusion protein
VANDLVPRDNARGVRIAAARPQKLADYLEIAGRVQADPTRVVRVYAPVSGRLASVAVHPADFVEAGQVLATIASSDVAAARAAYRQAEADSRVKQQAVERARSLYSVDAIALRDYQQAQADAAMSRAALEGAAERLALLNVDTASTSDQMTVRAPRAGVVTEVNAAPGEFAKSLDNADPLCTIADLSQVWTVGDVYEPDLASVRVGDSADVTLAAYPNAPRRGRIAAISSTVDTTTRTLKVRVVLANPGFRLKPDMFATIRVRGAEHPGIVVPQSAVIRDGTSSYMLVRTRPGHFERRIVALGRPLDASQVEVLSGVAAGDSVVVEGAELLRAAGMSS